MEEYLKRCRINLSQRKRLMEDSVRLEGMISLILTQLKACMLRGDCDSRSVSSKHSDKCWFLCFINQTTCRNSLEPPSGHHFTCPTWGGGVNVTVGDCVLVLWSSRSLRHWASGAVFHTQMLVHLDELLVAREALQQYKEDLSEIIAAYR